MVMVGKETQITCHQQWLQNCCIMSNRIKSEIIQELLQANYFGLILDSTPDVTHHDQPFLILRYVDQEGVPVESFIKFISINNHASNYLTNIAITELEKSKFGYC